MLKFLWLPLCRKVELMVRLWMACTKIMMHYAAFSTGLFHLLNHRLEYISIYSIYLNLNNKKHYVSQLKSCFLMKLNLYLFYKTDPKNLSPLIIIEKFSLNEIFFASFCKINPKQHLSSLIAIQKFQIVLIK